MVRVRVVPWTGLLVTLLALQWRIVRTIDMNGRSNGDHADANGGPPVPHPISENGHPGNIGHATNGRSRSHGYLSGPNVCGRGDQSYCCPGWTRRTQGDNTGLCVQPICMRPCGEGGICIRPNTCYCSAEKTIAPCRNGGGGGTQGGGNGRRPTPGGDPGESRDPRRVNCREPCLNGGRCIGNDRCACVYGFTGRRCERDYRTGPCFRKVQNQFCAGQLSGVVCTRQLCCATIGTAWGHPCEYCPPPDKMECQRGYITNVHSKSCQDVDECEAIPGLCSGGLCTNSPGSFRCTCKDGYKWDEDACVDVNECEDRQEICFNGRCINVEGSFYCICDPGYVPSHDRRACIDARQGNCYTKYINGGNNGRCQDKLHVRLSKMECCCGKDMGQGWALANNGHTTPVCERCPQQGSHDFQRLCLPGSSLEINECELRPGICENGKCVNTPDSYRCECLPGYVLSAGDKKCVDIDECANRTLCRQGGGRCVNTLGSFTCLCPQGYDVSPDGTACTDRNECTASGSCANGDCVNQGGSYVCRCKPGYKSSPTGKACVDVDECLENARICLRGRCQNTPGSYRCICDDGYVPAPSSGGLDSGFCIDRNECEESSICLNGKCLNVEGSFKCVCGSGYKLSSNGRFCIDLNECLETPNACANGRCENYDGGYRCVCDSGFTLGPGGKGCVDTRKDFCYAVYKAGGECTDPSAHLVTRSTCCCAAHAGVSGSHFGWGTPCKPCPIPGSQLFEQLCSQDPGTGHDGEDINECKVFPNYCPNGACENLKGSYRCICNPGYQIDSTGKICSDINECAINLLLCQHGQCRNTPGSYQCTCPLGYRLNTHTSACEDIDECREPGGQQPPDNGVNFPRQPSTGRQPGVCVGGTCINTPGSYRCECEPGSVLDATRSICIDNRKASCWLKISASGGCEEAAKVPMLRSECCSTVGKAWGSPCQPCHTGPTTGVDQRCPKGFAVLDGVTCTDVNECDVFPNICQGGGLCLNTEGSYRCNCPPGLTLDPKTGTKCIDYREEACYGRFEKGRCSRAMEGFFRKSTCCCSGVGEAWGRNPCQPCPRPSSEAFNELCPKEGFTWEGINGEDISGGSDIFDIDECTRFVDLCQNGRCTNIMGSFKCTCNKGFELDTDGLNCTDIDECSIMHSGVCANGNCRNIPGSFVCDCNDGFEPVMQNQMCNDIDECLLNRGLCLGGSCVNTPGSFVCDCPVGHELSPDGRYCKDVDECGIGSGVCSNGICENMMGAFWCICNDGYTQTLPQQTSCEDVDECTINRDNGRCEYQCVNTPGSYHCICEEGHELTPDGFRCKDVDECSENPAICGGGKCKNNQGSYSCECGDGLLESPDRKNCIDIDECLLNPNLCMNGRCENTEGSFTCRCDFGYSVKEEGQGCTDDDECDLAMSDCDDNAMCVNTPGSYKCDCRDGFVGDGVSCRDVNECLRNNGGCHMDALCINTDGSYRCVCDSGLKGDGFSCQDVDECSEGGIDICGHGQCINYPGAYDCECDQGFAVQNRRSCTDIDECSSFDKICMFGRCENAFGMFRCLCNVGYKLDESGGNCTDTDECENPQACQYGTCINTVGSYICQCPPAHELIGTGTGCVDKREGLCYLKVFGNYNGKGICNRQDSLGDTVSKATCCCTVGVAWGGDCDVCPTPGSSEYEQLCPSGPGFRPNVITVALEDVNECDEYPPETICTGGGKCANTFGSFMCSCPDGFILDDTDRHCIDADECLINPDVCGQGKCINSEGSYTCICPEGFVSVPGGTCVDMRKDGCFTQYQNGICEHKTSVVQTRHACCCSVGKAWGEPCEPCPINGTDEYKSLCSFTPGTVINPITGTVVDVDECQGMVCQSGTCINTVGSFTCICLDGYVYNPLLFNCEDINECQKGNLRPCTGSAHCVNIPGGFECRCPDGYKLSPSGRDCQDIDECFERPNVCQNGRCSNLEGSFRCTCNPGFLLSPQGDQCNDIDECNRNLVCSNNGDCVNTAGSYKCFCRPGFQLQGVTDCVDIDECRNQFGICQNGRCRNTVGSFECQCQNGYRLGSDGKSCLDVNECIEEPDMCRLGTCRNSDGSFQCTCPQGYMNTPDKRECVDVDECAPQTRLRPSAVEEDIKCFGGRCINTDGGFECQCPPGFRQTSDRKDCIDERRGQCYAKYDNGRCSDPKQNTPDISRKECCCMKGSKAWGGGPGAPSCEPCPAAEDPEFKQLCEAGIGYVTIGGVVIDIDECKMDATLCNDGECINTDGSFRCQCLPGFQLIGEFCSDVDECKRPQVCGTNGTCRNTHGSFECACPSGYAPGPKKTCEDVDECREMGHMCAFRCQNIPGSFQCTCPFGFKLAPDGKHCEDLDECATGLARECRYACKNLVGSYACVCPDGYEQIGLRGEECRDIDECRQHPRPCKNGRCTNTKGSFRCECYDGFTTSSDGKRCVDVRVGNCFQTPIRSGQCPTSRVSVSVTRATCCCGMGIAWGDRCELCPRKGSADYDELCPHGVGFNINGKDVDECLTMSGMCINSRCVNTLGSYRCLCNKGYEHPSDGNQIRCQDIDECSRPQFGSKEAGPCDQECKNTDGSFKCSCRKGFRLEHDGVSCKDIDECSIGRHDCQHNCVNTPGSFECSCRTGYEKLGKAACVDVDECSRDPGICSPFGNCKNVPGSYKCICSRGYTPGSDGTSCFDLNECEQDGSKCELGCENLPGSYRCTCPDGKSPHYYWNDCVDDNECSSKPNVCGSADCTNTVGSYSCNCQDGYAFDPTILSCIELLGSLGTGYGGCQPNLCAFGCTPVSGNAWACGCPEGYQRIGQGHCLSTITPGPGEISSLGGHVNTLSGTGIGDGYTDGNDDNIISTEGCYSCKINSHTNTRARVSRSAFNETTEKQPKSKRKQLVHIPSTARRVRHSKEARTMKEAKFNKKQKLNIANNTMNGINLQIPTSLTHPDVRILQLQPATNNWRYRIIYQIDSNGKDDNEYPFEMIESRGIYILHFTKEQNQTGKFQFRIKALMRHTEGQPKPLSEEPLFTFPVTLSITK